MSFQWWCAATGEAWTWAWRPYFGVWLFVALVAVAVWPFTRSASPAETRRSRWRAGLGVASLWVALDWPIGALGAGYLSSVHALQFLLIAFSAAPLLLLGMRSGLAERWREDTVAARVVSFATRPLLAGIGFNVLVIATHMPRVVDALMPTQLGAFAIDLAWLVAGFLLWSPIVRTVPTRGPMPLPLQMLYLFIATLVHTGLALVLLMAPFPLYRIYELAPPLPGWTAMNDQQLAGGVMELIGAAFIFGIISRLFFVWAKENA